MGINKKFTERQQALIDGVEFGLDHRLQLAPSDVAEYYRLLDSRCTYAENMENYRKYLIKYAEKHNIKIWEAHQHKLCRSVAKDNYNLDSEALKWFDENL